MPKRAKAAQSVLHLVPGDSAGGSLVQGLRLARRREKIAVFPDNLSFGPIEPGDNGSRAAWADEMLRIPRREFEAMARRSLDAFWKTVLTTPARRVLWMTRRSPFEYAAFLEWLWRLADRAFEVVDVTEVEVSNGRGPRERVRSLGEMPPQCFVENALWDRAAPPDGAARERYRLMWQKLRQENAPFRTVAGDDLVSAPITVFDEQLLARASGEWRKVAYVVSEAMISSESPVGDRVLHARVRTLVAAGRLEGRGDLSLMSAEVRLPRG
jgi:hypothetical protein